MPTLPLPYNPPAIGGTNHIIEDRAAALEADITRLLNDLNITTPQSELKEPKLEDNVHFLSSGSFGGATFSKAYTTVGGLPDTQITRKVTIESTRSIMDGLNFRNSDSSVGTLILIRAAAAVLFRNCVFNMTHPDGAKVWIQMESGAKAIFSSCMWRGGDGTGGNLVNNAGAAGNVQIVGCMSGPTAPGATFVNCSAPVASL